MNYEKNYIDYVKKETVNSLNEHRNEIIDVSELVYLLVEGKVSDRTWTYSEYDARELIRTYWDICSAFCEYYQRNYNAPTTNPIIHPELFLCQMMQEATENLIEQCDIYQELIENDTEELCLTDEIIDSLIQEIKMVDSIDFI